MIMESNIIKIPIKNVIIDFLLSGCLSSNFHVTKVDNTAPPHQSNGIIISNIQYFIAKSFYHNMVQGQDSRFRFVYSSTV